MLSKDLTNIKNSNNTMLMLNQSISSRPMGPFSFTSSHSMINIEDLTNINLMLQRTEIR